MAGAIHRPLPGWPSAVILLCSGPAEIVPVGMGSDCLNYLHLVGLCFLIITWLLVCLQCGRPRFNPWVGKSSWRRKWQPTPVFLPGKIPWTEDPGRPQVHGVTKSWTRLSDFTIAFSRITQVFVPEGAVLLSYECTLLLLQTLRWLTSETTKVAMCVYGLKNNVFTKLWGLCLWFHYQNLAHPSVHECQIERGGI